MHANTKPDATLFALALFILATVLGGTALVIAGAVKVVSLMW